MTVQDRTVELATLLVERANVLLGLPPRTGLDDVESDAADSPDQG